MTKKVVVYTCGSFDLFHVGHLNILRAAKSLGDKLIVGLSTDEVVDDYKPGQLVVPYDQRLAIVSAIRYVDTVVPQTDRDKFKAWQRLKYDVLAVGDDWYGSEDFIRYERELNKVGAKVCYLPHTPGVSSSDFRKKLEERYGAPYAG